MAASTSRRPTSEELVTLAEGGVEGAGEGVEGAGEGEEGAGEGEEGAAPINRRRTEKRIGRT